jgi:ParB family chromosome partitioning protein
MANKPAVSFKRPPSAQIHTTAQSYGVGVSREGDISIELDVKLIEFDPLQHRQSMDEEKIIEMSASIKAQGVLQNIVVRPATPMGRYPLVIGERRVRGSILAGKLTIPAVVRAYTDLEADVAQVVENTQREGVNPLHTAHKFRRMLDDHGLQHQELATMVGKSDAFITQHLRLLDLPPEVAEIAESGFVRDVDTLSNIAKLYETDSAAGAELLDKAKRGDKITRADSRVALQDAKEKKKELTGKKSTQQPKSPAEPSTVTVRPTLGLEISVSMNRHSSRFDEFSAAAQDGRALIDFSPLLASGHESQSTTSIFFEKTNETWTDVSLHDLLIVEMTKL